MEEAEAPFASTCFYALIPFITNLNHEILLFEHSHINLIRFVF